MKDKDIRKILLESIELSYTDESFVVEELGILEGASRVDIAVINGYLHGFEIKSNADNLARLPCQHDAYNKIFDYITIISGDRHIMEVASSVSGWWGLSEVVSGKIKIIRPPSLNPNVDPYAISKLLWRDEALEVLKSLGLSNGCYKKKRDQLCNILAESICISDLRSIIKDRMQDRTGWRLA